MPVNRDLIVEVINTIDTVSKQFNLIDQERKNTLLELASFIQTNVNLDKTINLNFICTHNSRRSHIAQIWAQAASYYYNIPDVHCFSGGTDVTAFNQHAIEALKYFGFDIVKADEKANALYQVRFSNAGPPIMSYSKRYDDPINPRSDFAAIFTCSDADGDCPLVSGAAARFLIKFDDPKRFDGTASQSEKYRETALEIGREMLFTFSQIVSRQ